MAKLTAEEIYDLLVNRDEITRAEGRIRFNLGNVDIVVKQCDIVGNIIQEWLEGWLRDNGIVYLPNPNTQMNPDIFLDPDNLERNLLEVKAFNYRNQPAFDIADFYSYQKEIIDKPFMLNVKYIIFGYTMNDDGIVTINRVWLKNIWEIISPMSKWPLKLQVKNGVVHKIRPANWYARNARHRNFDSLVDYLSAIEECVYKCKQTHDEAESWKDRMISSYERYYGVRLEIPRWSDIRDNYVVERPKKSTKKKSKRKKLKQD